MAFRGSEDGEVSHGIADDPWVRFSELHEAFDSGRGFLGDKVPLRFAAVTLLAQPGSAADIVARVRAEDDAIAAALSWFSGIGSSIRLLIASLLVKNGDSANSFLAESQRVHGLFRDAGIRRGHVYETLAVLVLRQRLNGAAITEAHVSRFKAIYNEMKRYHWFLTGPDDFPACAILVTQPGEPEQIGAKIEDVYQALHKEAHLWRGEALQTASNILYLSALGADEIAARFTSLVQAFRARGIKIGQQDYDEVAVLCFLSSPVDKIVDSVAQTSDRVHATLSGVGKRMAFSVGTSIAFVRLVAGHDELGPLADAKVLLDMQAVIAARQAAAAAGAAGLAST